MAQHLRLAVRALLRTPVVTGVAVLSLALGIGGTVAIFSLFHEFILGSLPVPDANRLVNFVSPGPKQGHFTANIQGDGSAIFSYPMFRDLQQGQTVFTGIAAQRLVGVNLSYDRHAVGGQALKVSGNFFEVLKLQPALGRLIGPQDDVGGQPVVVLAHAYWQSRFGSSPAVLDRTLVVNGRPLTIVGVAPRGFHGTSRGLRPNVYLPISVRGLDPETEGLANRTSYWAYLFARLGEGATLERAEATINVAYSRIINTLDAPLQEMSPQTMKQFRARRLVLEPGHRGQSVILGEAWTPLVTLLGVTAFVLLIACANIASVLLARAVARAGEISIRMAVGAGRGQLIVHLLIESCHATLGGIAWMLPAEIVDHADLVLNRGALVSAAVLTVSTGFLFGFLPAVQATRPDVMAMLKDEGSTTTGARTAVRVRAALVTGQIALSMALLIASGLFVRTLYNMTRAELGLDSRSLALFHVSPRQNGYNAERSRTLLVRLEEELRGLPGVVSSSAATVAVLAGENSTASVSVQGFVSGPDTETSTRVNEVGADYFKTLGIRVLDGREFTDRDAGEGSPRVAVVNQAFARKFNLGRDVVGKRMAWGRTTSLDIEIVGLVRDAKYSEVRNAVPPQVFTPYRQSTDVGAMTFYVRAARDPAQLLSTVRPLVARLDDTLPVQALTTMQDHIAENLFGERLISTLSAAFATLATLLAALGVYGVLSHSLAHRTREIGLRMALGAQRGHIRRMIVRQMAPMAVAGTVIGLAAGIGLGRVAESLLFELRGYDPTVVLAAALAMLVVACGASAVPTYRACRVDPTRALRHQ
jgi:predicted permease